MRGFTVTVVGEYIARSGVLGNEKVARPYEIEGNIPTLHAALSIVKNKLLDPLLSKKYSDYVTYRTYHITKISPIDPNDASLLADIPVSYMDRESLIQFCKKNNLPVETHLYPDLFKLREAVEFAYTDPKGYVKKLELRRNDLEMDREVAALNPEVYEMEHKPESIGSIAVANAPRSGHSDNSGNPGTSNEFSGFSTEHKPKKKINNELIEKQSEERINNLQRDMEKDGELLPLAEEAPDQKELDEI